MTGNIDLLVGLAMFLIGIVASAWLIVREERRRKDDTDWIKS